MPNNPPTDFPSPALVSTDLALEWSLWKKKFISRLKELNDWLMITYGQKTISLLKNKPFFFLLSPAGFPKAEVTPPTLGVGSSGLPVLAKLSSWIYRPSFLFLSLSFTFHYYCYQLDSPQREGADRGLFASFFLFVGCHCLGLDSCNPPLSGHRPLSEHHPSFLFKILKLQKFNLVTCCQFFVYPKAFQLKLGWKIWKEFLIQYKVPDVFFFSQIASPRQSTPLVLTLFSAK